MNNRLYGSVFPVAYHRYTAASAQLNHTPGNTEQKTNKEDDFDCYPQSAEYVRERRINCNMIQPVAHGHENDDQSDNCAEAQRKSSFKCHQRTSYSGSKTRYGPRYEAYNQWCS